jgi:hypothetical protein
VGDATKVTPMTVAEIEEFRTTGAVRIHESRVSGVGPDGKAKLLATIDALAAQRDALVAACERAKTAVVVLRTMLNRHGLEAGAETANAIANDLQAALAAARPQ